MNLSYVAAAVAQLKDTTPEEVITITEANAQKLLLRNSSRAAARLGA